MADLGMSSYAPTFADNDIDLEAMALLKEDHLKELGVSLGHRVKLMDALEDINIDCKNSWTEEQKKQARKKLGEDHTRLPDRACGLILDRLRYQNLQLL